MPASVKEIRGKYRVVEPSGTTVKRSGKSVDGGGHMSREDALKQATAININNRTKYE